MTSSSAEQEITATVLDYFEGWFEGDPERMDRALHPDLVKRQAGQTMGITTKEQMVEWTRKGEGKPDAGEIQISIEDVGEDIASVTVLGGVYHEYVHLVHTPEGWKVANALWRFR
jgi:hypothetical protein